MEKMRKKKGDTGRAILFLAPALLLICCFTVIPIFEAVYTSFHKTQYAMVGEFVGLKNYISVMVESDGLKNIINSIVYVVLSLLLAMPIGIGVGTLLNRKIRGMTIFRTMIIIPWTLSQTVTALLWKWLLNGNYGLITSWAYQLTGKKMDLFSSAIIAKILVVIVNVWNTVPVVIILTIAALQTISPELIEAAQVDGASRKMIYWKLTLPMIRPTMVTALVMQSIEYFNMVTLIYVLTAGGPFNATQTLSLAAYQNGFDYWHMDIAAAIVSLFPVLWGLSTALKTDSAVTMFPPEIIPKEITWNNFIDVVTKSDFMLYMKNSLLITLISIVMATFVAAHAAYALTFFNIRFRKGISFFILMTSMVPPVALLVPLYMLSVKLNLYNTRILLVLIYTAWRTPILTWIMEGFFRKLPMEIVEAGIIDGCSKSKAFYKLILPISQPGIVSAALLSAVYVWNDYLVSSSFITASEKKMISVGLYQYITQYGIKWGLLMAAVMISIIPIIILFICMQKRFVEGMAAGAVKG